MPRKTNAMPITDANLMLSPKKKNAMSAVPTGTTYCSGPNRLASRFSRALYQKTNPRAVGKTAKYNMIRNALIGGKVNSPNPTRTKKSGTEPTIILRLVTTNPPCLHTN